MKITIEGNENEVLRCFDMKWIKYCMKNKTIKSMKIEEQESDKGHQPAKV